MVFAGAIGLISGILGIWQFFIDNLPEPPQGENGDDPNIHGNTLRIQVGINGLKDPETGAVGGAMGGSVGNVDHWDASGDHIVGAPWYQRVEDGHFVDIELYSTNGRQAVTTTIEADYDDICIATMAMTFSDGSNWAWVGDWGKICGLPTFYSGVAMPNRESPRCTWLVRPPFEVTRVAKISVNWPAFYVSSEDGAVPSRSEALQLCGTAFKAWDFDGNDLLDGLSKGPLPRGLPHWGRSDDRLVVSSLNNQNATTLCQDEDSYGPDFVSLQEGVYCNMETRETLPLCTDSPAPGECFDVDTASHIMHDGGHKPKIRARNPTKVVRWSY